jgi:hypothetical protein
MKLTHDQFVKMLRGGDATTIRVNGDVYFFTSAEREDGSGRKFNLTFKNGAGKKITIFARVK